MPNDLYIPPDALEIFLDAFEGPLDLLLYLIRRQNFNILDIPMAQVTRQYLHYIEQVRLHNLELAAEYLLMAAMLIEIKSRMLLPVRRADDEEAADPRAELVRRLLEYEQMKLAARQIDALPQLGRDTLAAQIHIEQSVVLRWPEVNAADLQAAWSDLIKRAKLVAHHTIRPRGAVGARAHDGHPAAAAVGPLRRVFRSVRPWPRRAGRGGELHRAARAGQGNADRDHPGRSLRAHLCSAILYTELRAGIFGYATRGVLT